MAAPMMCKHQLFFSLPLHGVVRKIYSGTSLKTGVKNSKTMTKMLKKANRKKDTRWYAPIYEQKSGVDFQGPAKSRQRFSEGMVRRANYVSDVMYEAISQIVSSEQLGVQANITQVKVLPDMSHMNVYWEASGIKEKDEQTQLALDQNAKFLRHILMEAQAIGSVPRPIFVRDYSTARQRQVDEILHQITLENQSELDDLEDSDSAADEESLSSSKTEKESDLHVRLTDKKEVDSLSRDGSVETVETEFRQDLYDLQHDVLMRKVVSAKVSAIQRPTIVSDTKSQGDSFVKYDKLNTKFLSPSKPISRKKLLRRFEQEQMYALENEWKKSLHVSEDINEDIDSDMDEDIDSDMDEDIDSDIDEDNARIDSYIDRYKSSYVDDKRK